MMELLYFTDISQVDHIVDNTPELLRQKRPITGDIAVAYELERLGIDFIDEWDFLGSEDIARNCETAHLLSTTWWDEHLASTEYEGFSLSDTAQQDMIYPLEACLNARTAYDRILNSYQIEKISGYFLPPVGVIRTGPIPTNRAVRSVTQAVLFYMAEQRGIPVIKLDSERPLSSGTIAHKGIAPSSIKAAKSAKIASSADKIILVYEDGMYADELAALMETFDKLPKVKVMLISQAVLELGLQPYGSQPVSCPRLRLFWIKFIESAKNYDGDYPEIFGNIHLLFQFACIRKEMETAAAYGDVYAAFLDTIKPALVVFGHEAFTRERTLVRLARNRKICSVGLMHGVAKHRFTYRGIVGDADLIMVSNEVDFEGLMSYGVDKTRLNKIGCLRYEDDYFKDTGNVDVASPTAKRSAKKRLGLDPGKPLIVWLTAAINAGFASPVADPRKHRDAIRGFISLVSSRPDLQFVIKAHPSYDYYEIYRRLLDHKLPNLTFPEQAALHETIAASDICLLISYCTTAALEAMLDRVPVVYLENAVYPLADRQDNQSATGIHRVQTIPELEKYIDSLLTNPDAKAHALARADNGLKKFLDVGEVQANSRLYDFLKHVIYDQQTADADVLLSARGMHELLSSQDANKVLLGDYASAVAMKHASKHLMLVFAYLAGINNLGLASLSRIFDIFTPSPEYGAAASWNKARWFLLPAYVTGKINNSMRDGSKLTTILSLRQYLIYPHKFISAPALFKRYVIKHLIKIILGQTGISLLNWILKSSYNFSNALAQKKPEATKMNLP